MTIAGRIAIARSAQWTFEIGSTMLCEVRSGYWRWYLASAVLLAASGAFGQGEGQSIEGDVSEYPVGSPMAGCKAVLHSQAFLAEPITRNTKADDEGHFSFTGLPSGPYIISVDAPPGFVSSRFKPSAQIVQLKSGEISPKLEFRFARESGIAGSVLTEAEHPVAGANVTVLAERYDAVTGVTGIVAKGNTTTAADGSYRVTGLAPGRYRVYVEPAGATEGSLVDTYWPSALEYDQGQIVAAMPSQQVSNLTIKVRAGETSIVRGRWVRSAESRMIAVKMVYAMQKTMSVLTSSSNHFSAQPRFSMPQIAQNMP